MKKNKGFSLIAITLIIIAVLVIGGIIYFKVKNNSKVIENDFTNQPTENDIIQPVVKESTNIVDPNNPDMMIYTSNKLGIQFTYPKTISITWGSKKKNNLTTTINPISVTENDNKLIVSAGGLGSYYALIFHKNSDETFEQSIMRQLIKKEYQNNPCYVEKLPENFGNNYYRITFKGDIWSADGPWSDEALKDFEKCSPYGGEFNVVADPLTGGFYMATQGIQEPSFGDINSPNWWPKGIKFIK